MFSNDNRKFSIGVTLPLTGDLSAYGESILNGITLAVEEHNQTSNLQIILLSENNEGEIGQAISSIQKFIHLDKVIAIFNSFEYIGLATKEITEKEKTPMILSTTYILEEKDVPEYTFRDYWSFDTVGNRFNQYLTSINLSEVKILAQNDFSYQIFEKSLLDQNISVVNKEYFNYGTKDFRTILAKLNIDKNDTVIIYAFPVESSIIIKQMRELGISPKNLLITEGTEYPMMSSKENVTYLSKIGAISYVSPEIIDNDTFTKKYTDRFSITPRADAIYAYEDAKMIINQIDTCSYRKSIEEIRTCIKENLENHFDKWHNIKREVPLIRFENQHYKVM